MDVYLWLCIFLSVHSSTRCLIPVLRNASYNEEINLSVNESLEYIIQFYGEIHLPPVVKISSDDGDVETPLLVTVRQKRQVLSWQVPMIVDTEVGPVYFNETSRILCYLRVSDNLVKNSGKNEYVQYNPIISISSASLRNVSFNLKVDPVKEFFIEPNVEYEILISPSEPKYYFYNFTSNVSVPKMNLDTVVLKATSTDSVCMTISIQNASCPVMDLNSDITYSGFYETVVTKGGITIPKDKFPDGFFIVFVANGDDYICTGDAKGSVKNRTKSLQFIVKPSISYTDYLNAVIATLSCIGAFYVFFGLSFFYCSRRGYRPRAMEFVQDDVATGSTPVLDKSEDSISVDETEYDSISDAHSYREVLLNKPVVFLNDLARKDPRILKRRSYLYLYNVLTVAIFYGLPVVQLVITYQRILNKTGQQDLCYYNFLCAHPLGFLSDFNHLFSNTGYVLFGILFLWITYRRELMHRDLNFDRQYGIPQHYGMFYAMGVALIMEGVLSGSYHICPNHTNFQFDSSFMYVVAVLCMVKLYQNRHPDINATAYATFGLLAIAILLGMIGILEANIYFWIIFTIIHILTCLYLTLQIYFMGCWKFDGGMFIRVYRSYSLEYQSNGALSVLKPKYKARMALLIIGNLCNWALAFWGMYKHQKDFALYLLSVFMANTLLYFTFYIVMKLLCKERVNKLPWLFLFFSLSCAVSSMYFFLHKSISWALTAAQSREFNQDCALMRFYDFHDIWHFLSSVGMFFTFMVLLTLDDDLSHTHRSKIHVF